MTVFRPEDDAVFRHKDRCFEKRPKGAGSPGKLDGEAIVIQAVDDFEVARVHVTIRTQAGALRESGPAELDCRCARWRYTSQGALTNPEPVTIEALAADLAGNLVTKTALPAIAPPE